MSPRPQAHVGEAPKKEPPVDWQARSQGLEEALKGVVMHAPDDRIATAGLWDAIAVAREAHSLGLPDEEGECHEDLGSDPCGKPAVGERLDPTHGGAYPVCADHLRPPFPDPGDGAAPPPRGPVVQGSDVDVIREVLIRADDVVPFGEEPFVGWSFALAERIAEALASPSAAPPGAVRPISKDVQSGEGDG